MNRKITLRLLLSALFVSPCVLWACLDKSVWFWDPAMYALESVRLWRYLILQPSGYFHDMFTMIGTKAPMICWIGQFFAPLGEKIGYEKALLFMQVFFSAWMIFDVARWKLFQSSNLKILLAAVLVASTPIFIFQSHFYFVELSQTFGVLWVFGLYLRRKEVDVVYITCAYFALFFYLLGVKITSPFYIFLPSLGLLHECWIRRREFCWGALKKWPIFLWFVLAVITTIAVLIWYCANAMNIYHFAMNAARGKDALLYGQKAGLVTKFHFWFPYFCNLFFGGRVRDVFLILIGLCFLARWKKIIDIPFVFSLGQIMLILLAVCLQINQETRYIYPLLVYVIYIFARIIAEQNKKWIILLFICILLFRWAEVNLSTLGCWHLNEWLPWSDTIDSKGVYLQQANKSLAETVDQKNPKTIMMGVDIRQLNENLLQFLYFAKNPHAIQNYPIYCIGYTQNSLNQALKNIKHYHGQYVITLPEKKLAHLNNPWNRVSFELFQSLIKQGWYVYASGSHYLVLKKSKGQHD